MNKLSVIVPLYNEKDRIKEGFRHYYSYLNKQKYGWELIFVNDGSSDNTLELAKNLSKNKQKVKIISYPKNKGKGYAVAKGIQAAKGKYVLFTDIDHSVPIETVENFFEFFEKNYSVVIGSRRVKGAVIKIRQHPARELLGRGFTTLVNIFICWGVADSTCGFKAFENSVAQKIFSKVTIYDWAFDAEVIYICKKNKIKFAQAPVVWSDVKGSKVSLRKDVLRSLKGIFKIRINDFHGDYTFN